MFGGTIKQQLRLIAIGPLLMVILIVSIFLLKDSLQFIDDDLDKRGAEVCSQAVLMSEFYFYTGDVEQLTEVAESLLKLDMLNSIRFMDREKSEWVHRVKNNKNNDTKKYTVPVLSGVDVDDFIPINNVNPSQNILGYVEVELSKENIYSRRKAVYVKSMTVTSLALLTGLFLSYFFGRKLTNSITDLFETSSKIEKRNFQQRCLETGSGELLRFQKMFNKMAGSLQRNEEKLQAEIDQTIETLNQSIEELAIKDRDLDETRDKTLKLVREKAVADERSRIMKDIHDGIGGQLMASLSLIEKEEKSKVRENIHSILSDCLGDFRLIINSLNVHANTLSVLLADYKYSLSKKVENLDIAIDWTMEDFAESIVLTPQQGLHLLRILQEAFTNILKHSGATGIGFHTYEQNEHAVIVIEDNGKFLLCETEQMGHGLMNMKSRAQELGAELDISQSKLGGCRIIIVIPLPATV
ncbi:MAG: ATP-binding protein [Methylophagaceae bacterium]